jgi:hypothetical protein
MSKKNKRKKGESQPQKTRFSIETYRAIAARLGRRYADACNKEDVEYQLIEDALESQPDRSTSLSYCREEGGNLLPAILEIAELQDENRDLRDRLKEALK